ncbi:hypothetical protein HNY73_000490 [Argiope bruennichi]|uniref:Uncharacterized protein n=2 Tax=Argiope bruennichi TaxID=94029 RepID=A0A8T0FY81_ARGBR|nr:hypothetical protein HNY73_000490 [Argiope bruennichi]
MFLTEALHGQSKTSQNPKHTGVIFVQPPHNRNFNSDKSNNPRNNEYSLEGGGRGDAHSQSNRPPSSSYNQYNSNDGESSARNPLHAHEDKTFLNNREEQQQRFLQPQKHHQEINSFYPENGERHPHEAKNSKSSQQETPSSMNSPRTNQINGRGYNRPHDPLQYKKDQRSIHVSPDPYYREMHLQEKGERPVYEDYQKSPVNSRKALIREEGSEENSQWHESESLAPTSRRNNHQPEMSSYQPRNQFQIREFQSPQPNHSDNEFSTSRGQSSKSDSDTNYKQNFRPSQGTYRSVSHLDDLENEDLRDSVKKYSNADRSQQDNLNFKANFPPSKGNSRAILRSPELRNEDLLNSFRGHSDADSSMHDNLNFRRNYPPSEGTFRSVEQSDKLQSEDSPDSFKQHSNDDSLSQNNFNPQISGRYRPQYTEISPDFEHHSTNKDYHDDNQHNFQSPMPLERPHLKENSKHQTPNSDNFSPSQRLPHLDEDLPSNYNVYSNEKQPSSHKSVQNSKHPLTRESSENYPERQPQSEGTYSDFSDEHSPSSQQNNQNFASSSRTRSGQGRNQQELSQHPELNRKHSDRQVRNQQELPQHPELNRDYSDRQGRNQQERPPSRELHMDYSNRQGSSYQQISQPQELSTHYSNRKGRNHQELPESQQLHAEYSGENVPNFHQPTHTNTNTQGQLPRDNFHLNYNEPPPQSQGLQQKYSDENLPTKNEASQTSKIPYVRSFTEGRHLGKQESFQYLPENAELVDVSSNKKNNPSVPHSEMLPANKKGQQVAIGDYSVGHSVHPEEYSSPHNFQDAPSRPRSNKRKGRLENLPNNPLKEQVAGELYSEPDSRLPAVEHNTFKKSRSSRQRAAQRSLSPDQNIQNVPVKRSSEDDSTVKNLTFSATVERDHIVSMGSEQEPDSEPEPEERDDDDDDFGEEQHDGFLDMGAYTDKQGSFGWYADFPVGRGHDKVSYSSS